MVADHSEYWTNDALYDEGSYQWEGGANAKYAAYTTQPFSTIVGCVDSFENCVSHTFDEPISSALALFTSGYRGEGVDRWMFEALFGASGQQDCEPQSPGFNVECPDGNYARWGHCN